MSDLGALLRKAREQRGYTLEDIQETTKIRKRYLEAIETGDYKVLPGSFYVRAFVKTYAETVGLDAEEVLRLYQKELPKPAAPESAAAEPRIKPGRRSSSQHSDRWGKVSVTLLMWLFPILIVGVIWFYLSQNSGKAPNEVDPGTKITNDTTLPPSPTASGSPSASVSPSPSATDSASPSVTPVTFNETGMKGTSHLIDVSPGGPHKLQIEITGECWIDVNQNSKTGKSLLSKMFRAADAPQTLDFDLTVPLYINLGRADNAKITIDGTLFDDGDKANRIRFIFTPAVAP
jgi:cytoskeletal protein RodZ